jgi:hypothetical protein
MPSVTYSYVYFSSAKHQRQPRGPDSGFIPVPGMRGGVIQNVEPPSTVPVPPLPDTWSAGGAHFQFSFVNVSGGTSGGGASFNYLEPPPPAAIGTTPISITAVYIQSNGIGGDTLVTLGPPLTLSTNLRTNWLAIIPSRFTTEIPPLRTWRKHRAAMSGVGWTQQRTPKRSWPLRTLRQRLANSTNGSTWPIRDLLPRPSLSWE